MSCSNVVKGIVHCLLVDIRIKRAVKSYSCLILVFEKGLKKPKSKINRVFPKSETAKQRNSETAKQQNSETAKQRNSKTAKQRIIIIRTTLGINLKYTVSG